MMEIFRNPAMLLEPTTAALAVGALGAGVSAAGAHAQAKAGNKAGSSALRETKSAGGTGQSFLLQNLLGGEDAFAQLISSMPQEVKDIVFGRKAKPGTLTREEQMRREELQTLLKTTPTTLNRRAGAYAQGGRAQPNPQAAAYKAELDALNAKAEGEPGFSGQLDEDAFKSGGLNLAGKFSALGTEFDAKGAEELGRYDADSAEIGRRGQDIISGAEGLYAGREEAIDRDTQRAIRDAEGGNLARMAAAGISGSTLPSQFNSLVRSRLHENAQDAKRNLTDSKTQFMSGLKLGDLDRFTSRSTDRTRLGLGLQERSIGMRQTPLQMTWSALNSPVNYPMIGQNTTQYYPGYSPSGSAAQAIANPVGQMSGQALQFGMLQSLLSKYPGLQMAG